jgi:uncharacterized protein (TIGR00725 family)
MNRKIQIVVIGDSIENETNNNLAYETGKFIASQGWVVLNGGNGGVMAASSKGATENNGIAISILNSSNIDGGNSYATIKIPTGIGWARNSVNVLAGDVVVAIGGKSGTLSELSFAWCYGKPIIAFANSEGWSAELAGKAIDDRHGDTIISVETVDELKTALLDAVGEITSDKN